MPGDEVLYRPVTDLAKMVRARQVSPVELTRAYLARIERLNPKLSAFATVTADLALGQARQAEREIAAGKDRGPLHGIPYGAKDLVATKGTRTTWGAKPYEDQVFDQDAAIVRKLRDAGAVLLGKLAMIELAGGLGYSKGESPLQGAAHNPWGLDRWTCGSSSGSAAAVAAGLVPFAIGSETWGSIICPSSFCGVTGLRPTFGRVSRQGAMALSWTLDKLGPMARSARDCEIVLERIQGHDPEDPYSADEKPAPPSDPAAVKKMKIGCLRLDRPHGRGRDRLRGLAEVGGRPQARQPGRAAGVRGGAGGERSRLRQGAARPHGVPESDGRSLRALRRPALSGGGIHRLPARQGLQ